MSSRVFMEIAIGVSVLGIAVVLALVLLRAVRTLAVIEETLLTAEMAMHEVVPELKGNLDNLNQITAGVNVALRVAGQGAEVVGADLGDAAQRGGAEVSAWWSGLRVGSRSLWRSYFGRGGPGDG